MDNIFLKSITTNLTAKNDIELKVLDDTGYPRNCSSLLLPLKRENIPGGCEVAWFEKTNATHHGKVNIACKYRGEYSQIQGCIVKVSDFSDGFTVVIDPEEGTLFYNWKRIVLWVPKEGSCGILNPPRWINEQLCCSQLFIEF